MKYFDIDKLNKTGKISHERITKIIKDCKFAVRDLDSTFCEAGNASDVLLEEITTYDDILNKVFLHQKTSMYVYKDKVTKKQYMLCFKPTTEMAMFRSIKQKLADLTTSHVIQKMTDVEYETFFFKFYNSMNTIIESYANMKNLSVPDDICFFYKGGNLYRILLSELFILFDTNQYTNLLKRSDADFQLFINPKIPGYKTIFAELSTLVTFVLYSFKKYLLSNDFNISNVDPTVLEDLYKKEYDSQEPMQAITDKKRQDFMLMPIKIDGQEYIMYKEVPTLLDGIPKLKPSQFYITRNTSIRFKRKDNTYNSFDLLRMKYNIKVKIGKIQLNVPSEIIDIGIPREDDNTIPPLTKGASKWMKKYNYSSNITDVKFAFWGPSLSYLIKDVDSILFYQNEFPWQDKKIEKRLQRYLLCIILHTIVTSPTDPIFHLTTLKNEFNKLINFLTCFNDSSQCEMYGDETVSGLFYAKYKKILATLNAIKVVSRRTKELRDFKTFNENVIAITKNLIVAIRHIIANTSETKLKQLIQKVHVLHTTSYLGGTRSHRVKAL